MKCPDDGLLLSYLERQLDENEMSAVSVHLASCRICKRRLQVLQDELTFCRLEIAPLLQQAIEAPVSGQYRVWEQIDKTRTKNRGVTVLMKLKKIAAAAVMVVVLVGLLSIPSVQAAAENLLQVFRVNQISTVTLTPEDINHLQSALTSGNAQVDLEKFGQIKTLGEPIYKQLASRDQLPYSIKLPADGPASDLYVEDMPDVELTLHVNNVNLLLKQLGSADELPAALDGKTFRLVLPEMVIADYGDFKIIQGASPEIQAPTGVAIAQIRQAIINLPVWTPNLRMQLTAIQDWQHTLVIPQMESQQAQEVQVGSNRGVFIAGDASGGQLMWQDGGRLLIVAVDAGGAAKAINIAESLR